MLVVLLSTDQQLDIQWCLARTTAMLGVVGVPDDSTYEGSLSAYGLNIFSGDVLWLEIHRIPIIQCLVTTIRYALKGKSNQLHRLPETGVFPASSFSVTTVYLPQNMARRTSHHGIVVQLFHIWCHVVSPVLRRRYHVHETISADPGSDIDHGTSTDHKYGYSPSGRQVFLPSYSPYSSVLGHHRIRRRYRSVK